MKNDITLKFYGFNNNEFRVICNFGWSIKIENGTRFLTLNNEQLWNISPTNFLSGELLSGPNVYVAGTNNNGFFFDGNVYFNFEQTAYDTCTFTTINNTLLNLSIGIETPLNNIQLFETTKGSDTTIINIAQPNKDTVKYNSLTIETGYDSNEHYGVICKLYNKSTNELVETKPQSTDTKVTFNNLYEKTDYVVIVTYVCNEDNSNYNYDNFVEITTTNKTIVVYGNNKGIFQEGELYASPNQDSIFKEVAALYYKDENNNWTKMK